MPPNAAKSNVEGSGTAAGLAPKLAAGANVPPAPLDPPMALASAASRPESLSAKGDESVDDTIDELGSAASTRLSNRLTSKPGSVAASRSIAAMRFSNRWPVALLIVPEAIASWMAVSGSLGESLPLVDAVLVAEVVFEAAAMAPPSAPAEGAIVTVELALIVSVFCKICVAVRLAAFVPSPTVVLPAYTRAPSALTVESPPVTVPTV